MSGWPFADGFVCNESEQQVPPLRYAPVGMTNWFECWDAGIQTELSSRPERSAVEGPAVSFCPSDLTAPNKSHRPSPLSSRPKRSVVEGPAVSFLTAPANNPHYSVRKAWTGSIEAARCAGITLARSAQNPSAAMEPASTTGSQLFTW
jgi:hypothetical protein